MKNKCEVTVIMDEEEFTFFMDKESTVLEAALDENIEVPFSCQGGICSTCITKLTAGSVVMKTNNILSDIEVEEGYILACQSLPTTQKITIDYDSI